MPLALFASFEIRADDEPAGYNTPAAYALLPPYCRSTGYTAVPGGRNPAEVKRWGGLMGPSFAHMHHYCWALFAVNRAIVAPTAQERQSLLGRSIGDFSYVIENAAKDFVLLPEIHTKRGESLLQIGNAGRAIADFMRAIELKADYWPPYVQLSDHFKKIGDLPQAREWAEKGLSLVPTSRTLQERIAELEEAKTKSAKGVSSRTGNSPQTTTKQSSGGQKPSGTAEKKSSSKKD